MPGIEKSRFTKDLYEGDIIKLKNKKYIVIEIKHNFSTYRDMNYTMTEETDYDGSILTLQDTDDSKIVKLKWDYQNKFEVVGHKEITYLNKGAI